MSAPDDLRRRLVDLADAAGPWDDPLPEVRRRAEVAAARARPDRRRWFASTDWTTILVAAAVAVIAVGLGSFLIKGGGSGSSKTASAPDDSGQRVAAGSAAGACRLSRSQLTAAGDAVRLIAPSRIAAGRPATVRARLSAGAGLAAGPLRVYVVRAGAVVAELDPTTAPSSTAPSSKSPLELSATGAFTRTSAGAGCAVAATSSAAAGGGAVPGPAAGSTAAGSRPPLPPGTYQLIAVIEVKAFGAGTKTPAVLVSRPVDVVVH